VPRKRLSLVRQRQPDTGAAKTTSAPMARNAATPASTVTGGAGGQALAYFYYEDEPGRRAAAKLLTKDEARRFGGEFCQAAGPVARCC
jgi:hypothetical protein